MTNGKITRMGKMSLLKEGAAVCMKESCEKENVIIVPLGVHRKA
jgi:hypothetical protein